MDSGVMDPKVATRTEPPHRIGKNVREIEYLRDNYKIAEKRLILDSRSMNVENRRKIADRSLILRT